MIDTRDVVLAAVKKAERISPEDLTKTLATMSHAESAVRKTIRDLIDSGELSFGIDWKLVPGDGISLWP